MIFLDSSFLIAYSNELDEFHNRAIEIARQISNKNYGTAVITDYVFDEVITNLLVRTKNFKKAVETGEKLLDTTLFFSLNIDSDLFFNSWTIFKAQHNPRLSITDCSILAVCRSNGIDKIATFDRSLKEDSKLNIID